jgi:protein-L-isoaspartate(D-aspartate) O-methyltransferase
VKRIDIAFIKYPRNKFLPKEVIDQAGQNIALPIGYGQTNSQPSTVRQMLEWLQVKKGQTILDVGCGSGWTTALLSHLTGPSGKVFAVERIPELLHLAIDNCNKQKISNTIFYLASEKLGLPGRTFDKILISASAQKFPNEIINQLAINGSIVVPVKNDIYVIHNTKYKKEVTIHNGYVFVPLI